MESSKQLLGTEGCSSSESGWTMYIDSPIHEEAKKYGYDDDDDHDEHNDDDHDEDQVTNHREGSDADTDDSMVSDASSRPYSYHHHRHVCEKRPCSHGITGIAHKRDANIDKYLSRKKANKQERNGESNRRKVDGDDSVLVR